MSLQAFARTLWGLLDAFYAMKGGESERTMLQNAFPRWVLESVQALMPAIDFF